ARAGASVCVVGQSDRERLDDTVAELRQHTRATGLIADVADPDAVRGVAAHAEKELGPVDILVNMVGTRPKRELEEITVEEWDEVFAVNLRASFLLAQATMPGMRERGWGRVINTSGLDATAG